MKTLSYILTTVLIVGLVAAAGLSLSTMVPIPGKLELKVVQSGSMEPVLLTGSLVVIQPVSAYAVGDIITFGEDSTMRAPTTHRIVDVRTEGGSTYFTTKGDANEENDVAEAPSSSVIGRVLFSIPYAGYLVAFSRTPLGFALLVIVPAVLVILHELWNIIEELRGKGRRRKTEPQVEKQTTQEPKSSRILFMRASPMEDVFVARLFTTLRVQQMRGEVQTRSFTPNMLAIIATSVATLAVAALGIRLTTASYGDLESSLQNLLSAAVLDFAVDADAPRVVALTVGPGEEGETSLVSFIAELGGSLPFAYGITAEMTGGDSTFCNALLLSGVAAPFDYDGPLLALSTGTTTDQSLWSLTLSLPDDVVIEPEAVCMVDLVYTGVQEGGEFDTEYHDEERLPLMITYEGAPALFQAFSLPEEPDPETETSTSTEPELPAPSETEEVPEPDPETQVEPEVPQEEAVDPVPENT